MSSETLDDIFSNTEVEATAETEETVEETTTEQPEQEAEESKEEESKESATTAEAEDDKTEWTKKMALDERRKRQELERRYAELEAKLKAPEGKEEGVDFFADPDKALGQIKSEVRADIARAKLEIGEELMRERYEDFDELASEFVDLAKDDPQLVKLFNEASNPAKYAYDTAKKARERAELNNIDTYREKIRAEEREKIRAELEAEMKQAAEKAQKRDKALAPSLANQRAAGALDEVATETLDDIFRGK